MVPFLNEYKMGLTVLNPIAAGLLTGKHTGRKPQENSRFATNYGYAMRYFNDSNLDAVDELSAIAAENGMSLLEFSLQWLLNRPAVDSLIVGASRYEHVVQNIALASEKKELSPEAMKKCDAVWDTLRGHYFSYHANARPMRRPPAPGEAPAEKK